MPDLANPSLKTDRSTGQPQSARAATAAHSPASKRGPYAKSSQTREKILAAAFEVAGEVGLHRAAVAMIAERARVAVGNVHYHFGSRDNLLHELMEWVQQDALLVIENAMRDAPNIYASLEATVRAHIQYVRRNPAYIRLAEEVRLHQPDLYKEGLATWLGLIRGSLESAIAANEIRAMDPDEIASLAHFILGTRYFVDQMIECVDGRPYPGDDSVVATYLNFVQYGVQNGLTKRETP